MEKILEPTLNMISGGQSGVDRAALDCALILGLDVGGYCPKGRWAEDGSIDEKYPLIETASSDLKLRTRLNVESSDGTLILIPSGVVSLCTDFTVDCAQELNRPVLQVDPTEPQSKSADSILKWIRAHQIQILNVAGPRESESPGIYAVTLALLTKTFPLPPSL